MQSAAARTVARLAPRALVALAAGALLVPAAPAHAELTQRGNLFIRFDGGISPKTLPRHARAPIGVRLEGTIRALGGKHPPALRRLRIAINRGGKLDTRGLPACRRRQIANVGVARALAVCGASLVGTGGTVAKTTFGADQRIALIRGSLLLFATRVKGRDAILAYLKQGSPAPSTNLMVFNIRRTRGTFGTVISARIPRALARNAYLTQIFMRLQRTYVFRGRRHAYLSAACAAPKGFSAATFPFARATAAFSDGRVLTSTVIRTCRVRG